MLKKNRRKELRKKFFYIHTNIVTKKCWEQNVQNNFSRNTRIVRAKNVGKKMSERSAKKVFYIHKNILTKKWGEKTGETIFPETHE